jgi:hypothetical protein
MKSKRMNSTAAVTIALVLLSLLSSWVRAQDESNTYYAWSG